MPEVTIDWTDLREFHAVDLTKSFVLTWQSDSGALQIDLDLCLTPEHLLYEKPRPAERACFRPALLEFPDCTSVSVTVQEADSVPVPQAIRSLSHGRISGLRLIADGEYELSGDFGTLQIHADRPILRLKELTG